MDWNSSKALAIVTAKVYMYNSFGDLSLLIQPIRGTFVKKLKVFEKKLKTLWPNQPKFPILFHE